MALTWAVSRKQILQSGPSKDLNNANSIFSLDIFLLDQYFCNLLFGTFGKLSCAFGQPFCKLQFRNLFVQIQQIFLPENFFFQILVQDTFFWKLSCWIFFCKFILEDQWVQNLQIYGYLAKLSFPTLRASNHLNSCSFMSVDQV